jgi:GR25 family glycosyltransferase involved in LPS biosynthesis
MENINHILYINLESRGDRKIHVEKQLKSIGLRGNRFNAIKLLNGAIGCSMSHLRCLQFAKEQRWDHLLIVEDDIDFLNPKLFKTQFNKFLNNQKDWDVVLLAGNNLPPYEETAEYCIKVSRCQTTTSYMVKSHYYDTLINNIRAGISLLMKEPNNHRVYAIDKFWFQLQQRDKWYLITPLSVVQRQDYSDIENRVTNYSNLMLNLDKKSFFMNQLDQIRKARDLLDVNPVSQEQIAEVQYLQKMQEQVEEDLKFFDKKK